MILNKVQSLNFKPSSLKNVHENTRYENKCIEKNCYSYKNTCEKKV